MAYFRQSRHTETPTGWPTRAEEEITDLGAAVNRWESKLSEQFPQLLGHLVWDPDRLSQLEQAAQHVVEDEGWVKPNLVGVYRRSLLNRVTGLGPLDDLLLDESVSDIMVNGAGVVFCDRNGMMERVEQTLGERDEVVLLAQRLAARAGRTLTTQTPLCDAQLSDGSRIHCAIPPVAAEPAITIRRRRYIPLSVQACLESGAFSEGMWRDLVAIVQNRLNIMVAGGAGTGKTSLLRLLASAIPASERLVVIEDVRELRLDHANAVSLETRSGYDANELVNHALRMRPDRILVGEVRGAEVLALIEAMATGHPGSLSTVHSRSGGIETVHRLARIAVRNGAGLSFGEMVEQIRHTVEVIVYMTRTADGRRRISAIDRIDPSTVSTVWKYDRSVDRFLAGESAPC